MKNDAVDNIKITVFFIIWFISSLVLTAYICHWVNLEDKYLGVFIFVITALFMSIPMAPVGALLGVIKIKKNTGDKTDSTLSYNGKHEADSMVSLTFYDPDNQIPVSTGSSKNSSISNRRGISEEYFDLCNHQSKKMLNYLESLNDDKNFIEFIDNIGGLESIDKIGKTGYINTRLLVFFIYDLAKINKQLGHEIRGDSKELLTLALILFRLTEVDYNVTYQSVDMFYSCMMRDSASFIKTISEAEDSEMTDIYSFYLPRIFNLYGESDRIQPYNVILYRYASLVAKADGTIGKQESEYLSGLMKMSKSNADNRQPANENKSSGNSDPIRELNSLTGLSGVKEEVEKLTNFIKIQQIRNEQGLKTSPISYHCVFTGNPGTGKTTVARIIAEIYRELGILKKGHLVETDRSGLVAEYVGQTAVKTNKIIDSALDGVLFIDEAYSLVAGNSNDYGIEAISTLLKRMEDDRDRLVVVLAGYGNEMKTFIDANPGLQSRFNRYIHFEDYSADELVDIFKINVNKNDYILTPEAEQKLSATVGKAVANKDKNFGNARFIRNMFEKTLENQATRLASEGSITKELLQEIKTDDIPVGN